MLTLYVSPGSCALASHIALEETGAAFEAVRIDTRAGDQRRPEYLALNPKGRVPALATEHGLLTENPAILAYIAQAWPDANLAPLDDPFAFARAQAFNSYLASTVHVAHAHGPRAYRWADEESSVADMRRKVPQTMAEAMQLIEGEMLQGPWVMGEAYTICDPYLFTICGWLQGDGVDIDRFPALADHFARMNERPAVQRVLAREAALPRLFA